jgi:hypothetical protein
LQVERRIELEEIEKSAGGEAQVPRVDDVNGAVGLFERDGLPGSGNHYGLCRGRCSRLLRFQSRYE